jgi:hypothetical protein
MPVSVIRVEPSVFDAASAIPKSATSAWPSWRRMFSA